MCGFIDSSYVATLVSYVSQRMFYVRWILLLIPNQKTWAVVFYACYVFPYFPIERGPRVIVPISGKEDLAEIKIAICVSGNEAIGTQLILSLWSVPVREDCGSRE